MADQDLAPLTGFTEDFYKSVPELWDIYKKARSEGWAPDRLLASMRNTDWFRQTSDSAREAKLLQTSNPAEWKQRMDGTRARIEVMAANIGFKLTGDTINKLAEGALKGAWSEEQLRMKLADSFNRGGGIHARASEGNFGGALRDAWEQITQRIHDQGVSVSAKTRQNWLHSIAAGRGTIQDAMGSIDNLAMKTYAGAAERIKAGETVRDVASPYIEMMSELLEMNPNDVHTNHSMIRSALNSQQDKGYDMENLASFERRIKQTGAWDRTNNARGEMMSMGRGILQAMGFTAA